MGSFINLHTLVDRKTRFLWAIKINGKHANETTNKCISLLNGFNKGIIKIMPIMIGKITY